MGKHDSDEGMGFFLGGAEAVKNGALWIKDNIKIIFAIALIPIVGFGAYYGYKYYSNYKKNNSKDTLPVVASNSNEDKEYVGGYEVLGSIDFSSLGINVKVLNPTVDETDYIDDALTYGAVLYYGNGLNEIGNTAVIAHNDSNNFFNLENAEVDSEFTVTDSKGNLSTYTVIEVKNVQPDDLSILLPMEENSREITLITCDEAGTERLVIKAISK
jgi:LPXTG-site transpeptidase (sortase) family protein